MIRLLILTLGLFLTENEHSQRIGAERAYQVEVEMPDQTRCDLVSDTHAIEVEWAEKWKEAPAQATLYSVWTGKKPKVLLLVKDRRKNKVDILRCQIVCERLGIEMETYDAVEDD